MDSSLSLDAIFGCCGQSLLVAPYLLGGDRLFQAERMRTDTLHPFRQRHGDRIRLDRDPQAGNCAAVSVGLRVHYAVGQWHEDLWSILQALQASQGELQRWGVIAGHPHALNIELNKVRELIVRAFIAQRARTMRLWEGGVYNLIALLSLEEAEARRVLRYWRRWWPRFRAYQAKLHDDEGDAGLTAFSDQFVWQESTVLMELLEMLDESRWRVTSPIRRYLLNVTAGVCHSKGVEDIFKALRRLCKKGSENHMVRVDRLWHLARTVSQSTFPNCPSESVSSHDWEAARFAKRADLQSLVPGLPLSGGQELGFAKRVFRPREGTWPDGSEMRKPKDVPNRKTCSAPEHSGQVGLQACIAALPLDDHGEVTDWSVLTRSWCAAFVPTLHEAKGCQPTVLLDQSSQRLHLVLALLAKRCVLTYPLDRGAAALCPTLGLSRRCPPPRKTVPGRSVCLRQLVRRRRHRIARLPEVSRRAPAPALPPAPKSPPPRPSSKPKCASAIRQEMVGSDHCAPCDRARVGTLVVKSVLSDGDVMVLPVEVDCIGQWRACYRVTDAPISVLEHAMAQGLVHVPSGVVDLLFRDLNIRRPRKKESMLAALLDVFADEWGRSAQRCSEVVSASVRRTAKTLTKRPAFETDGELATVWAEILADPESDADVGAMAELTAAFETSAEGAEEAQRCSFTHLLVGGRGRDEFGAVAPRYYGVVALFLCCRSAPPGARLVRPSRRVGPAGSQGQAAESGAVLRGCPGR